MVCARTHQGQHHQARGTCPGYSLLLPCAFLAAFDLPRVPLHFSSLLLFLLSPLYLPCASCMLTAATFFSKRLPKSALHPPPHASAWAAFVFLLHDATASLHAMCGLSVCSSGRSSRSAQPPTWTVSNTLGDALQWSRELSRRGEGRAANRSIIADGASGTSYGC